MNSVIEYTNPIYIVQLLTIVAFDGAKSYVLYIQDMVSFKIVHYQEFKYTVKSREAALAIYNFLKSQVGINYSDVVFAILKVSPFANQLFMNMVEKGLSVKLSYFSRKDYSGVYQTHKILIKSLISEEPHNINGIVKSWNELPNHYLANLEFTAKKTTES